MHFTSAIPLSIGISSVVVLVSKSIKPLHEYTTLTCHYKLPIYTPVMSCLCCLMISSHRLRWCLKRVMIMSFFLMVKSLRRQADFTSRFSISSSWTLHSNCKISCWSSSPIRWGMIWNKVMQLSKSAVDSPWFCFYTFQHHTVHKPCGFHQEDKQKAWFKKLRALVLMWWLLKI